MGKGGSLEKRGRVYMFTMQTFGKRGGQGGAAAPERRPEGAPKSCRRIF